jgi:two-component system sensor histidine kinase KdpD
MPFILSRPLSDYRGWVAAPVSTALLVAVMAPFREDIGLLNAGFIFLLLTLVIAAVWGREVGLFAAVLTNLAFNFFFIDPLYKFTVQEPSNFVALAVFLAVSVVGGTLLSEARRSAQIARRLQAEAEAALALSRALSLETEPEAALRTLCREVTTAFAAPGAAVLARTSGAWSVLASAGNEEAQRLPDPEERSLADRAAEERRIVGMGGAGLEPSRRRRVVIPRGREAAFERRHAVALVPLRLGEEVRGLLRLDGPIGESPFRANPERLLDAIAGEAAITLQRLDLAGQAAHAQALREADEMKSALMASISHDLKTPLAGIKASVSSLLDERISWSAEDIDAFHQAIDSQADRLNRIISDILDLNRIESGSLTPEHASLSVRTLLDRAREVTAMEARGREVVVDADESLAVLADEALIMQALVNLIENAIKYSTAGGSIRLTASRDGDAVSIRVADEGPGITPEDLPYVFERFYRADEHSRRVKGSGLGLTVVKGFVELCGGTVNVESSPAGTTFSIRLPASTSIKLPA